MCTGTPALHEQPVREGVPRPCPAGQVHERDPLLTQRHGGGGIGGGGGGPGARVLCVNSSLMFKPMWRVPVYHVI